MPQVPFESSLGQQNPISLHSLSRSQPCPANLADAHGSDDFSGRRARHLPRAGPGPEVAERSTVDAVRDVAVDGGGRDGGRRGSCARAVETGGGCACSGKKDGGGGACEEERDV